LTKNAVSGFQNGKYKALAHLKILQIQQREYCAVQDTTPAPFTDKINIDHLLDDGRL
jgi:hypothetical protein